jgi:hypothetical protein
MSLHSQETGHLPRPTEFHYTLSLEPLHHSAYLDFCPSASNEGQTVTSVSRRSVAKKFCKLHGHSLLYVEVVGENRNSGSWHPSSLS